LAGAERIAEERKRQIAEEGWTADHDDNLEDGDLALAGASYVLATVKRYEIMSQKCWPWDWKWYKPTPDDKIRQLTKAGALIAAEIDRLERDILAHSVLDNI